MKKLWYGTLLSVHSLFSRPSLSLPYLFLSITFSLSLSSPSLSSPLSPPLSHSFLFPFPSHSSLTFPSSPFHSHALNSAYPLTMSSFSWLYLGKYEEETTSQQWRGGWGRGGWGVDRWGGHMWRIGEVDIIWHTKREINIYGWDVWWMKGVEINQ